MGFIISQIEYTINSMSVVEYAKRFGISELEINQIKLRFLRAEPVKRIAAEYDVDARVIYKLIDSLHNYRLPVRLPKVKAPNSID